MTPNSDYMHSIHDAQVSHIITANNSKVEVTGIGKINMKICNTKINLNEVLHVPNISANLLSVNKIVSHGNAVIFNKNGCTILDENGKEIVACKSNNGIYKILPEMENCLLASKVKEQDVMMWHRRMGHLNFKSLEKMRDGAVYGMNFKNIDVDFSKCESCAKGKQSRFPFKASITKTTKLLELVHTDLCGPMETTSIGLNRYILTFEDDFSKKTFCYLIKNKSEVLNKFKEFTKKVQNETGHKIVNLRSDNGTEYLSKEFDQFCKSNGIRHQLTCPYTAQQNGVAERYNRTILEKAKCLLHDANLSKEFWGEAVNMAVYLINRSVCSSLDNMKTPEEMWSGEKIDVSNIRIFGSKVFVHIPKQKRRKLDFKSETLIFVGYDPDKKGFRCMNENTKKVTISRDVIFKESSERDTEIINMESTSAENCIEIEPQIEKIENEITQTNSNESEQEHLSESEDFEDADDTNDQDYVPDETVESVPIQNESQRRMTRARMNASKNTSGPQPFQFGKVAMLEPIDMAGVNNAPDMNEWKKAMQKEIEAHRANNTWSIKNLPPGKKAIKAKWVFKKTRRK